MVNSPAISLGGHFDEFISKEVSSGKYGSASEVIKTALSLLEEEEKRKELLVNALIIGEMSPPVKNFDAQAHLKSLHDRLK